MKLGITILIHNKDDIEFVTEFPCLLGHPVFNLLKIKNADSDVETFKWTKFGLFFFIFAKRENSLNSFRQLKSSWVYILKIKIFNI